VRQFDLFHGRPLAARKSAGHQKWYRSLRASQVPLFIDHFSQSEHCGRILQDRSDQAHRQIFAAEPIVAATPRTTAA
jgi:hypothetical protein